MRSNYMLTRHGHEFDFENTTTNMIDILDINHGLQRAPRFAGHTKYHYSVANHSIMVMQHVPKHLRLAALLHDAAEAYMCDVPRPLKALIPEYRVIENRILNVIYEKFGIKVSPLDRMKIKIADSMVTERERIDLMQDHNAQESKAVRAHCHYYDDYEFLEFFKRLTHDLHD